MHERPEPPAPDDLLPLLRSAGDLCERIYERMGMGDRHTKADHSPVTIADYACQALILKGLAQGWPGIPAVAEESGRALRGNRDLLERVAAFCSEVDPDIDAGNLADWLDRGGHNGGEGDFWALDPIDGTKGYLRGGQYALALAWVRDGHPWLGWMACPRYEAGKGCVGRIFAGGRGFPAREWSWRDDDALLIRVADPDSLLQLSLCESVEGSHTSHERSAAVASALGLELPPLRMDSQAKYAALARGDAHLYLRLPQRRGFRECIWDHAAGTAILEAAGGCVTDLNGRILDFGKGRTLSSNRGVLGSTGRHHSAALEAAWKATPEEARWT